MLHSSSTVLKPLTLAVAFASAVVSLSPVAIAQVEIVPGPNFAVLLGASGFDGCLPREAAQDALRDRVLVANEELGVDPELAVVFSLDVPQCSDLFYSAVANDIRGIGYQHRYEDETFDESPGAALEGVAFLNDVFYWDAYPEELRRAFLHEISHRWGARVHVSGESPLALLGRDHEHWSYFLDSSFEEVVSPLEGNAWAQEGARLASSTHEHSPGFSDLDLYLMGALAPEEVAPFSLVVPRLEGGLPVDCRGAVAHESSPPQHCESAEVEGTIQSYTVDDVVAVEGQRLPSSEDAPREFEIGFYFLVVEQNWDRPSCERWQERLEELVALFGEATRGRMSLTNITRLSETCDEVDAALSPPPPNPARGGCRYTEGGARPFPVDAPWLIMVLGAWIVRHRRMAALR